MKPLMQERTPSGKPPTEPFLRIEAGMHTAPIIGIDVDAAERYLVTASLDKTARVWNLASGKLLQVLRPPIGFGHEGKLSAVAISSDGTIVAVGGWTGYAWDKQHSIYLFDLASGRLTHRISGLPEGIAHLAYSQDGRYLAAVLAGPSGIRLYRTNDYSEAGRDTDYGDHSYWAEFDRQGRLVVTCYDGDLRLYSPAFRRIARQSVPGGKQPFAARFSPDGSQVAVGFVDSTVANVLSGEDLTFLYAPNTREVNECDLRLMVASDSHPEKEIIDKFEREFEPKKTECAVLIVRASSDSNKWTVAGFNDAGEFRTVVIDDPDHELSKELIKDPANQNRSRIAELAISNLGRTPREVNNGDLSKIAWSTDGQTLYAGGYYTGSSGNIPILKWLKAGRGAVKMLPAATNTIMDLRSLSDGRLVFGAADPAFGVFDAEGRKQLLQSPPIMDHRGSRSDKFLVSENGSKVQFGLDT
jgi:WD40 repeat protein